MKRRIELVRRLRFSAYAVLCWLAAGTVALAQGGGAAPGQPAAEEAPPFVVSYALVVLCIGLGVAIVVNSSKRRDRAKPEVFGEPK
jgi:hypothetical protein